MPAQAIAPREGDKRFRVWIKTEHYDDIEQLSLELGVRAGGVLIARDQIVNMLLREALDARKAKKASSKANTKKHDRKHLSAKVRHNDTESKS